jgi:hypothetical protein
MRAFRKARGPKEADPDNGARSFSPPGSAAATQQQGGPALDFLLSGKRETLLPIGEEDARHVARQQPGQHQNSSWRCQRTQGGRQGAQGFGKNICENEIIRGAMPQLRVVYTGGETRSQQRACAIAPGIFRSGYYGSSIDIAADDRRPQQACRRQRQNACSGSDIQNTPGPAAFADCLQGEQTTECGAVMTGTECEGGWNCQCDVVGMVRLWVRSRADHEASSPHRLQAGLRGGDPLVLGNLAKRQRLGNRLTTPLCDQRANPGFVRRVLKIDLDHPISIGAFSGRGVALKRRRCGLRAVEGF